MTWRFTVTKTIETNTKNEPLQSPGNETNFFYIKKLILT